MAHSLTRKEIVQQSTPIILIVFFAFLMRSFLSVWNSYWFDELFSVNQFGIQNASGIDVIRQVSGDPHPPLYQLILFYWMRVFGDSELATRSLSNLYIAGATVSLYVLVLRLYSRRVAIAVAIFFSLMFIPLQYAMETRSYAQSIFLSCFSSLLFFSYLRDMKLNAGWKVAFWNRKVAYLTGANLALLLTHYFNVLFVAAQALFLLVYVLHRNRGVAPLGDLAKVAALSAVPVVLFLAVWGLVLPQFYEHYITPEGLSDRTSNPLSLFIAMVAHPNLGNSPLFSLGHLPGIGQLKALRHSFWEDAPILLWLLGALVVTRLYYAVRNIPTHGASVRSYATVYFVFWALVPCLIAWLIFLSFSRPNEHLFPRYFAICSPEGSRLENLLETGAREIAKHDYLILAFTHFRSNEFQGVLDKLARRYQPYLSLMNRGRGVIVWKVTGDG